MTHTHRQIGLSGSRSLYQAEAIECVGWASFPRLVRGPHHKPRASPVQRLSEQCAHSSKGIGEACRGASSDNTIQAWHSIGRRAVTYKDSRNELGNLFRIPKVQEGFLFSHATMPFSSGADVKTVCALQCFFKGFCPPLVFLARHAAASSIVKIARSIAFIPWTQRTSSVLVSSPPAESPPARMAAWRAFERRRVLTQSRI
jgi:hypothetical protein